MNKPLHGRQARMLLCSHVGDSTESAELAHDVATLGPVETVMARSDQFRLSKIESISRATEQAQAMFIIPGDEHWPARLADLGQRQPYGLWVIGDLSVLNAPTTISISGARAATNYGIEVASELSTRLAQAGQAIVSGLSYGIDSAAHRGALSAAGKTIAVLPNGLDRIYPATHADLAKDIADAGALISEIPPRVTPSRQSFINRMRLVAALGDGFIIVEASMRSAAGNGGLTAGELGRPVMAVPGPIYSGVSTLPNQWIRTGQATAVTSATDVQQTLAESREPRL